MRICQGENDSTSHYTFALLFFAVSEPSYGHFMGFRVNSFLSLDVNLLACVVGVEWGRGKGERNKTGSEKAAEDQA